MEVPIADKDGRATGNVRPVRYKTLQSGVPLDDWVGRSVVHRNICCDRVTAYSQDKIRLYFMDPDSKAMPCCSLSPVAMGLVVWDSAKKHLKNWVLSDKHDAVMAKIAGGINHFPINTLAGATMQCLVMALASIATENRIPEATQLDTCDYHSMSQHIKKYYANLLAGEVTIGWGD